MKIKLDENLPSSLIGDLSAFGHDVDSVKMERLTGTPDPALWQGVQRDQRFFITQDMDFSNIHLFRPGTHFGLLLLKLNNPSLHELSIYLTKLFETEDVDSWSGCFVVADKLKVRVRRKVH